MALVKAEIDISQEMNHLTRIDDQILKQKENSRFQKNSYKQVNIQ